MPTTFAPRTLAPRIFGAGRRRQVGVVAALFALVAPLFLLIAPSASAATAWEHSVDLAVHNMINAERRAYHLPTLAESTRLQSSARAHNRAMATYNTMSHQLPREAGRATRISRTGLRWTYAGENIGWNSQMTKAGVLALESIMYGERPPNDGHRLNILSRRYRYVGVDIWMDYRHHKVWLTTDYAS